MLIEIQITPHPIAPAPPVPPDVAVVSGAVVEFSGVVRDLEDGGRIQALEYEAFAAMAEAEMRRILTSLAGRFPCLAARVVHRIGLIPAGETAIHIRILAAHRQAAFGLLAEFMDCLKRDVPIWKRRAVPLAPPPTTPAATKSRPAHGLALDEARLRIESLIQPRAAVSVPLAEAAGRILQAPVWSPEDLPAHDRSTRDGYAVLRDDRSLEFHVVDTLHAASWRPRVVQPGEAVRVATGSAMPREGLRVIMQEDVERVGDRIKPTAPGHDLNLRPRGTEFRAGAEILAAGTPLQAGALALLATVGCTRPSVNPRLQIVHFTTGDELVDPGRAPLPGQIRDSNSILVHGWLAPWNASLWQQHLPEDLDGARAALADCQPQIKAADLLLISGGASVGDRDFTRALLEHLNFEIIFHRLDLRPGAPLIFGVSGRQAAFGIPGNPLSHVAVWHSLITVALARMTGARPPRVQCGALAGPLADAACPRETLWPARCQWEGGRVMLTPLPWSSAGDVGCLAAASALIRVPSGTPSLPAGASVDFFAIS